MNDESNEVAEKRLKAKRDAQLAAMFAPDENPSSDEQPDITNDEIDQVLSMMSDGSGVHMEWVDGRRVFSKVQPFAKRDATQRPEVSGFKVPGNEVNGPIPVLHWPSFAQVAGTLDRSFTFDDTLIAPPTNPEPMKQDPEIKEVFQKVSRRIHEMTQPADGPSPEEMTKLERERILADLASNGILSFPIKKESASTILLFHHDPASYSEAQDLKKLLDAQGHRTALVSRNVEVKQVGAAEVKKDLLVFTFEKGNNEESEYAFTMAEQMAAKGYDCIVVPHTIKVQTGQVIQSRPSVSSITSELLSREKAAVHACMCCGHRSGADFWVHLAGGGEASVKSCKRCAPRVWGFEDGKITKCSIHQHE